MFEELRQNVNTALQKYLFKGQLWFFYSICSKNPVWTILCVYAKYGQVSSFLCLYSGVFPFFDRWKMRHQWRCSKTVLTETSGHACGAQPLLTIVGRLTHETRAGYKTCTGFANFICFPSSGIEAYRSLGRWELRAGSINIDPPFPWLGHNEALSWTTALCEPPTKPPWRH